MDWLDLLAVQGTLKSLLQHHSSKASILRHSAFFTVQLDLQDLVELKPKKDVFFIIGDRNAKVGSQETPGVTGKFGLRIRNEAGQRIIEFCQENALVIANALVQQYKRRLYTWPSPDVNTEIRLIIFFTAKNGEALNNQTWN